MIHGLQFNPLCIREVINNGAALSSIMPSVSGFNNLRIIETISSMVCLKVLWIGPYTVSPLFGLQVLSIGAIVSGTICLGVLKIGEMPSGISARLTFFAGTIVQFLIVTTPREICEWFFNTTLFAHAGFHDASFVGAGDVPGPHVTKAHKTCGASKAHPTQYYRIE